MDNVTFKIPKDIETLSNLAYEIWNEYWVCLLSKGQIDYMLEKFQSPNSIKEQIENQNYIYYYILFEDKISGYTGMQKTKEYLFLSKLYIKKEYRHKGLGTKAFQFIKEFAKNNNYNKIRLTVNKQNKNTIEAYLKWGFKTIDAVVTDIGSDYVMDDYIMEYTL